MELEVYDLVALMEPIGGVHKGTGEPIGLRRGQVGTVLMVFGGEACLVDFVDEHGVTCAMETVAIDRLLRLVYGPVLLGVGSGSGSKITSS